ncbi:hypothetical protein AXF42_Ash004419 [Apostasia shenzhenica]|uniref:Uncharacterized protein n=1 Tax=Apostasia shenzhenica TaxID=1088818 RepID=A0A2I0A2W5_9ASPA|nr:hypothetical protein AXF42_Ash004419 [Apostasia shenzhenica]
MTSSARTFVLVAALAFLLIAQTADARQAPASAPTAVPGLIKEENAVPAEQPNVFQDYQHDFIVIGH